MLRLRSEDRFTILTAPLSMTTRKGALSMDREFIYGDGLRWDFATKYATASVARQARPLQRFTIG
jgi:hypothetical protein